MYDISHDMPTGGGANVPASGDQLTHQGENLCRNAAIAAEDRKEVSL
jgi:hypothetical protein